MAINIKNIKVEGIENAVGINTYSPRFSWIVESDEQNVKQNGYRIVVKEWIDVEAWDSGYVESDENINIYYRGRTLSPLTQYRIYLTLTVNGKEYTEVKTFRTGLLDIKPPHVGWIRPNVKEREYKFSPYMRKEFALNSNEVAYATAHISSRGWYELYINGERPDNLEVMAPACYCNMDYPDKSYIKSYDVTDILKEGQNCVGVMLGNGYSSHFRPKIAYAEGKRVWMLISIAFTDGGFQHIWTDDSWKWHTSPITFDHIYDGEWYDATKELTDWNKPGFDDSAWENAEYSHQCETVVDDIGEPVRILGTRPCVNIQKFSNNVAVYDFKYNGAGVLKIKVKGDPGAEIVMRHAECVHPDGSLQTWTNRNAEATDRYILKGEGEEVYAPRFTYHCFRYAEIEVIGNAEIISAEALVYGTDMFSESRFECSSEMINRIQENFIRTLKTNFMSWPTDTGVRDERTACCMDIMVYEEMAMQNCNAHNYFHRWVDGFKGDARPDWSGDGVVCAYLMYKNYGDKQILRNNYVGFRGWAQIVYYFHLNNFMKGPNGKYGFGDWAAPNPTNEYKDSFSSDHETNYAMWYLQMNMLIEIAEVLGETEDIPTYKHYAKIAKEHYLDEFYDAETGLLSGGKQTPNLLALANGILEGAEAERTLNALVKSIKEKDNSHLDTGIFGTRKLIEVLSESDEGKELVYDILHQTTYPSFGHQIVARDATTAWEQWYGLRGMMTCSHSMFCGLGADFYKRFAGIVNLGNAYKKVRIKPIASDRMTFVNCTLETPRGIYKVNWQREGGFKMQVTVPVGCIAEVELPNGKTATVESGYYEF